MANIWEMAQARKETAIQLRRTLHMYPEPSFQEHETARRLKEALNEIGIPYRAVTDTGIVAEIQGALGRTVALRADMDALEVAEQTGLEFASRIPGAMHACGHDVHMASLLIAGDILWNIRDQLRGRVLLVFQPAEEFVQGAPAMIQADPFMEDVDAIFGMHVYPYAPAGTVCCRDMGTMFAGEKFIIRVKGKSGHGATPHQSVDALLAASAIVMNSQAILGREIDPRDPAVVTICTFQSGTRHNVIAGEAELSGTYRCYSEQTRTQLREAITRMAETTAANFRATAEVEYLQYVPPVVNDPALGRIVRSSAQAIVGEGNILEIEGQTGSDDFAYFQQKAPGYYYFIGCGHPDEAMRYSQHHSMFYADEDCLPVAAAMYAQCALSQLEE